MGNGQTLHPFSGYIRVPGQVPGHTPPLSQRPRIDPEIMASLQTMPAGVTLDRMLDRPVLRAQDAVSNLGLTKALEHTISLRIQKEASSAQNQLVFQKAINATMIESGLPPDLQGVINARAARFYRTTLQKSNRMEIFSLAEIAELKKAWSGAGNKALKAHFAVKNAATDKANAPPKKSADGTIHPAEMVHGYGTGGKKWGVRHNHDTTPKTQETGFHSTKTQALAQAHLFAASHRGRAGMDPLADMPKEAEDQYNALRAHAGHPVYTGPQGGQYSDPKHEHSIKKASERYMIPQVVYPKLHRPGEKKREKDLHQDLEKAEKKKNPGQFETSGGKFVMRVTDPKSKKHKYYYDEKKYQAEHGEHLSGNEARNRHVHDQVSKVVEGAGCPGCDVSHFRDLVKKFGSGPVHDSVRRHVNEGTLKFAGGKFTSGTQKKDMKKSFFIREG